VGRGEEGLLGVKLKVTVVVPFLEREHGALIMEEFGVELVLGSCWNKDDLVEMGVWRSRVGFLSSGSVPKRDGSEFEQEEVVG
jgi:hypothetical protein